MDAADHRAANPNSCAALSIATKERRTSSLLVCQFDTLMRIALRPVQTVLPNQHSPGQR